MSRNNRKNDEFFKRIHGGRSNKYTSWMDEDPKLKQFIQSQRRYSQSSTDDEDIKEYTIYKPHQKSIVKKTEELNELVEAYQAWQNDGNLEPFLLKAYEKYAETQGGHSEINLDHFCSLDGKDRTIYLAIEAGYNIYSSHLKEEERSRHHPLHRSKRFNFSYNINKYNKDDKDDKDDEYSFSC